jgi:hypothetical protein
MGRNNSDFHFGKQGDQVNILYKPDPDAWEEAMGAAEESMPKFPSLVRLHKDEPLVTGQDTASASTISSYRKSSSKEPPTVFTHQGQLWVHDGHHRIAASRLNGEDYILVKHWSTGE